MLQSLTYISIQHYFSMWAVCCTHCCTTVTNTWVNFPPVTGGHTSIAPSGYATGPIQALHSSIIVQSCSVHRYEFVRCPVLQCTALWIHPLFSPAMYSTVNSSIVQSCIVHPCEFVYHCPVLQCPPLWIRPLSSPAVYSTVNSSIVQSCSVHPCEFIHCSVL